MRILFSPAVSSFVSKQVKTFAQTFIIPSEIKALGFTTSKAGITTKELIRQFAFSFNLGS